MPLFTPEERSFAIAVGQIMCANPFLPERIAREREAQGSAFIEVDPVWSMRPDVAKESANHQGILARVRTLNRKAHERLRGTPPGPDAGPYEDIILYELYYEHEDALNRVILDRDGAAAAQGAYRQFRQEYERLLQGPLGAGATLADPGHVFACFFQIRRAFHHIFAHIHGRSMPAARLRASVWQSIFTHDMRRYRRSLHARMGDLTTLINGPSGTGKELVARAIGFSRYIPLDEKTGTFAEDFQGSFHPLNISALSPTLVESELFGHRRGAFTGAVEDRKGWLEICSPLGTVFLDEVGEIDAGIQVKLLRVLQSRTFQRLGETAAREFKGKLIAATNRDLAGEMDDGHIRQDFYYRLCSDLVVTPSLREQLDDAPGELTDLIRVLARRIVGPEEADDLASEVRAWIDSHLGSGYPWPGNVRELEQCVRNVLIRNEYRPARRPEVSSAAGTGLAAEFLSGELTADEMLSRYCTLVYSRTDNYVETARRLQIDRRTVKSRVDEALLASLRARSPGGDPEDI